MTLDELSAYVKSLERRIQRLEGPAVPDTEPDTSLEAALECVRTGRVKEWNDRMKEQRRRKSS